MQKIEIKNFGPIRDINFEIKDFNVFIGPQASGKSTLSKTIYFFKSLRDDLVKYVYESIELGQFNAPLGAYSKLIRAKFLDFWGPTFHANDINLTYHYQADIFITITLDKSGKYVDPNFSKAFKEKFIFIIDEAKQFLNLKDWNNKPFLSSNELIQLDSDRRAFFAKIQKLANDLFAEDKDLIFIPAGRSLLATLSDQLSTIHPHRLDFLMRSFIDRINNAKPIFNKSLQDIITDREKLTHDEIDFEKVRFAIELIERILKGKYQYDKDGEKIYFDNEKFTKLNYSSSGQQESIWILLLVFLLILENRKIFIVFEEPEAHLYPEAQKQIVDLISLLGNSAFNQIIITTHSPYILASINNLVYANKIAGSAYQDVAKKINPFLWIKCSRLNAYYMDRDTFRNILDYELESMDTNAIDSASGMINEDYDYLFNLE
jgi:AAA15 family ATPase/GTPase